MPKNLLVRNSKRFALREWNSSAGPTETDEKACLVTQHDGDVVSAVTQRIRSRGGSDACE